MKEYQYDEAIDDVIAKKQRGKRPEIDSIYIRVGAEVKEKAIPFFDKKHQPIEIPQGKPKTFYHEEAAFYINRNNNMESYLVSSSFEYPEGVNKVDYINSLIAEKAKTLKIKTDEIKVIEFENQVYVLSCSSGISGYFYGNDVSLMFEAPLMRTDFVTEPKEFSFHGTSKEIVKYDSMRGSFAVNEPLYFGEHFDALKNFIERRLKNGLIVVFEDSTNSTFPGNAGLLEETKAMSAIFGDDPNFIAVKYSTLEKNKKRNEQDKGVITPIINGKIEEDKTGNPVFTIPDDVESLEKLREIVAERKREVMKKRDVMTKIKDDSEINYGHENPSPSLKPRSKTYEDLKLKEVKDEEKSR